MISVIVVILIPSAFQRTNAGLAAGARALDAHFQILDATLDGHLASCFGGNLRSERGALVGAPLKPAPPEVARQRVALAIGDRDDRVVKEAWTWAMPQPFFLIFLRTFAAVFAMSYP